MSFNIRSIYKKYDEFLNTIHERDLDIIGLQETWINTKRNKIIIPGYKLISTTPNDRPGCGIAILIRENINFEIIEISKNDSNLKL